MDYQKAKYSKNLEIQKVYRKRKYQENPDNYKNKKRFHQSLYQSNVRLFRYEKYHIFTKELYHPGKLYIYGKLS